MRLELAIDSGPFFLISGPGEAFCGTADGPGRVRFDNLCMADPRSGLNPERASRACYEDPSRVQPSGYCRKYDQMGKKQNRIHFLGQPQGRPSGFTRQSCDSFAAFGHFSFSAPLLATKTLLAVFTGIDSSSQGQQQSPLIRHHPETDSPSFVQVSHRINKLRGVPGLNGNVPRSLGTTQGTSS